MRTTRTLDDNSRASDPGSVELSLRKLAVFHPELVSPIRWAVATWLKWIPYGRNDRGYWLTFIAERLMHGDSRAALVVSTRPLRVAAYTDELDCVAMLHFPDKLAEEYQLAVGSRLLTCNTYAQMEHGLASDLEEGEAATHRFGNFSPLIAEFLTDEMAAVEFRKAQIGAAEWQRTKELAAKYVRDRGQLARDGRPLNCWNAAT